MIFIEGRIKTRNWVNQAGVKQYRTEIIADSLQLGPRGAGSPGAPSGSASNYGKASNSRPEPEGPKQDEIPIIEENYTPPSTDDSGDQKTVSFEGDAADEIDVKDIPF